jgi:glycosyltransferase involved in cell wall biosynthesis
VTQLDDERSARGVFEREALALRDEVERREQTESALQARMEAERKERERTVRELDADVRALTAEIARARPASSSTATRLVAGSPALPLSPAGGSRLRRTAQGARAIPGIVRSVLRSPNRQAAMRSLLQFATRPGRARDAVLIERSGLFDAPFYVRQNPDVAQSGVAPLVHYVLHGGLEGRQPHPLFDTARYRELYPDVGKSGLDPLTHFLLHGAAEERSPGPDFDTRFYLASNPDVRAAGVNPLSHFLTLGWQEGRNPSPSFDCRAYLARYDDVRISGLNPLLHFVEHGRGEGRDGSPAEDATPPTPPRVQLRSEPLAPRAAEAPLIVCLTHVCPWPPHAGNAYRVDRLLHALQGNGFRIIPVIVPLPNESPDDRAIQEVLARFSNVVVVERDGRVRYQLRDVPDVLGSLSAEYTPQYSALLHEHNPVGAREQELLVHERTYCHDAAIATVLRLESVLGPYVFLTEYVWMSRLLPLLGEQAVKVIDTHDVYSTKAAKVLSFGVQDLWMEPAEEARRLERADLVIAIQPDEREVLQQLVPGRRVVTAGVDFEVRGATQLTSAPRVLFVGSGNALNVRGLKEFLRFAWPSIRERVPDAELIVAGAVSEAVHGSPAGVQLLGRVEDLDELYAGCRVVINPAVAGTGLKIKSVEALSRLRPLVTWPAGADGLPADVRSLCDIAKDWYEFSLHVVRRLDPARRESFSDEERRLIERSTSSDAVYGEVSAALREQLARRRKTLSRATGRG